jgi:4-amino-4-deoxy-L-arabinose transferase-like glycosyltransferase
MAELLVLFLPVSLILFWLSFHGRGNGLRRALVAGMVLFGVVVVVISEVLSYWRLLSVGPIAVCWLIVCMAAVIFNARVIRWRKLLPPIGARLEDADVLFLIGLLSLLVPTALLARIAAPAVDDAMAYHLPRVVLWMQAKSLDFFPTNFPQQIALQPFNEYVLLHTYVLSGGDAYVNLVQWVAFVGCIVGVSLITERLGGSRRAQLLAALVCATIPSAVLQASGTKNDMTLAFALTATVYFALSYLEKSLVTDLLAVGLCLSLAVLTKATGYLFAPPLLAGVLLTRPGTALSRLTALIPVSLGCILALNTPHFVRCYEYSGSPIGIRSVYGDGEYRFENDRISIATTVSNVIRNVALHFSNLPGSSRFVYGVHTLLGLDTNDPATTWPGTSFHKMDWYCYRKETCAASPLHVLMFLAAASAALWRAIRYREGWILASYSGGLSAMFVLFCIFIRWQPWHTRMHTVMLILGSALIGIAIHRYLTKTWQTAVILLFIIAAQPHVYANFDRTILGLQSVLVTSRTSQYFSDHRRDEESFRAAIDLAGRTAERTECDTIGIDNSYDKLAQARMPPLEYPVMALLKQSRPDAVFLHVGVHDPSQRYADRFPRSQPCVVVCLACKGDDSKIDQFRAIGPPVFFGQAAVFLAGRASEIANQGRRNTVR